MKRAIRIVTIISILLIIFCDSGTNPDDINNIVVNPTGNLNTFAAYPYTVIDSLIIVETDSAYCDSSISDNIPEHIYSNDTAHFFATDSTLNIVSQKQYDTDAQIKITHKFRRFYGDTRTGIESWWKLVEYSYEKASGVISTNGEMLLNNDTTRLSNMLSYGDYYLNIDTDTVFYIFLGDYADILLHDIKEKLFNIFKDANVDTTYSLIDFAKNGSNTVTATGLLTKEIVTMVSDQYFNTTFSSSETEHMPFTEWVYILECPQDTTPQWIYNFILGNLNSAQLYMDLIELEGTMDAINVSFEIIDYTTLKATGKTNGEIIYLVIVGDTIIFTDSNRENSYEMTMDELADLEKNPAGIFKLPQYLQTFFIGNVNF